jgi:cell division protein FtsB
LEGLFDGITRLIAILFVLCCIFVPLGVWKLVKIMFTIGAELNIAKEKITELEAENERLRKEIQ